ncbi:MAG: hypothetical protein SXQ77_03325, partial [Halobacteria archaeon]|nr:hypothetical protein [Halobacteria archaeon]
MTWISALIALPIIAAIITLFVPKVTKDEHSKYFALAASLVPLAGSVYVWQSLFSQGGNALLDPGSIQLSETVDW